MIFSNFFKAKWQHKDSNVRITAINNDLDVNTPEHLVILKDLLQHDESELVRRTALIKLADFDIFLNESENNTNKKIKEFSRKQVTQILTGEHSISLSKDKKLQYIQTANSLLGLEAWLTSETDTSLVIALFDKINKPQLLMSVFSQKPQAEIQHHLLKQVTEKSQLEKLLKKACNEDISAKITDKITETIKDYHVTTIEAHNLNHLMNIRKTLSVQAYELGVITAKYKRTLEEVKAQRKIAFAKAKIKHLSEGVGKAEVKATEDIELLITNEANIEGKCIGCKIILEQVNEVISSIVQDISQLRLEYKN